MQIIDHIPVFGAPVDFGALEQAKNALQSGARHVALMGDHHLGYGVPIGGVVGYVDKVSPSGVGYDIACGNKAVRLDIPAREAKNHIHRIMDDVVKKVSFGVGRINESETVDHPLFDSDAWSHPWMKALYDRARTQLGTVGSGNHYVDIMIDELDRVWIGVHFGSRGFGHGIATYFHDVAKKEGSVTHLISTLSTDSQAGQDYLQCMNLAGEYAYAGRDWVCNTVAKILGGKIEEEIHNHHNFAWQETHFGEQMWVVRKGATPAFPGQKGFVGATMVEEAVILEGVESDESPHTLYSTVHGAGRAMGRREARGDAKKGVPGKVTRQSMDRSLKEAKVVLRGGEVDESKFCYKRLDEVLAHHASTVRILHRLRPIGVAMAGQDVVDPYKD